MTPLRKQTFIFNPEENGGEALSLTIEWFDNGDAAHGLPGGVLNNQKLTLQSYCNSASFELTSGFTPTRLRLLADIIEKGTETARSLVKKVK